MNEKERTKIKVYRFTIDGTLPGLNELIAAERTHRQKGARLKRQSERIIRTAILQQIRGKRPKTPIYIKYTFFEKNKFRDKDNVSGYAHKVIQDSLVKEGIIPNDGWYGVSGFSDSFFVDKQNPRIEVALIEPAKEG